MYKIYKLTFNSITHKSSINNYLKIITYQIYNNPKEFSDHKNCTFLQCIKNVSTKIKQNSLLNCFQNYETKLKEKDILKHNLLTIPFGRLK